MATWLGRLFLLTGLVWNAIPLAHAHDHAIQRGRLVFSYGDRPAIGVLDLDSGEVTHRFDVAKPNARLVDTPGSRIVLVVPGDERGTVLALDTGMLVESHGDHLDVTKMPVRLLGSISTGNRPSHITSGFGQVGIFYDGPKPPLPKQGAKFVVFGLDALVRTKAPLSTLSLNGSQHGLAVPLSREAWAVTTAKRAYQQGSGSSLPDGFKILDRSRRWKALASFDNAHDPERSCKELHGHATLRSVHGFGCEGRTDVANSAGGLLLLSPDGRGWTSRKLLYPDDRRSTTLKAGQAGRYLVASYGREGQTSALLRVDPQAQALSESEDVFGIAGEQHLCQFAVTVDGRRVANLLADGTLRFYDIAPSWKEVARFDAVAPFDCSFGAPGPKPHLTVQDRRVFVTDPEGRRIIEFDGVSLHREVDLLIDGRPSGLPVLE